MARSQNGEALWKVNAILSSIKTLASFFVTVHKFFFFRRLSQYIIKGEDIDKT